MEEPLKKQCNSDWRDAWKYSDNPVGLPEEPEEPEEPEGAEVVQINKPELELNKCPLCDGAEFREDSSNQRIYCAKCGFVLEQMGDDRPDFGGKGDAAAVSVTAEPARIETINPLMPHASMNTDITYTGHLRYSQFQMMKLNRWTCLSPLERSLHVVFNKIEQVSGRYSVPSNVQHTTKWLFKRVYEQNSEKQSLGFKREGLRGTKRDGLIAACMYMSFKINGLYWTKTVVAKIWDIDLAEIRRGLAIFADLVKNKDLPEEIAKITGCKQYIQWFSVGLGLSRGVATMCCKMYSRLSELNIVLGKQPQSVAAGCLWAICQEVKPDITIDKLVNVTGISKATIREVMKTIKGADKVCLLSVFADDMCDTCDITNPITRAKIAVISKALYHPALGLARFGFWNVAFFAIYFVLVVGGSLSISREQTLIRKCGIESSTVLEIAKCIAIYRDDLSERIAHNNFS